MTRYISFFLYTVLIFPLLYIAVLISSLFNDKIKKGLRERKGLFKRLKEFRIKNSGRLILFHCVSMGEVLQAKPIAKRIKAKSPDVKIVVSFISPSGYDNLKDSSEFDFKTYLPIDRFSYAHRFFSILRPDLWIIVKHDIWPNHVRVCAKLNIPVILIDANLPRTSKRLMPIVKLFFKSAYEDLDLVLPVSESDAERFLSVYPLKEKVIPTGDTRYDQVYSSAQSVKDKDVLKLKFFSNKTVLVCGSVWKEDLENLLHAIQKLIKENKSLYVILVPHEINNAQMSYLEGELKMLELHFNKYSDLKDFPTERILIIDCVGLLAVTYKYGCISYVGGSFSTGVHNVMEPAIFRNPVLFGPKYINSFEAIEMVRKGGAFSINNDNDFYKYVSELLINSKKREDGGIIAESVILENLGASNKIMNYLDKYIITDAK